MSDDFDIGKIKTVDIEDLFNGEYERKNNPFAYFISHKIFKDKTIFGYVPYHVIFRFPSFLCNRASDLFYEIKWGWQRAFRGWDDTAVWSLDQWLDDRLPNIITVLKENKSGIPNDIFEKGEIDENGHVSEENEKRAHDRWNKELDKMIAGFVASRKLRDLDYNWRDKVEEQAIKKVFDEGMQSFVKHYHSLWD